MAISEGGIGLNIGRQEKTVSTRFLTPGLLKSGASTVWSGRFLLSPPLFGILSSMMTIATFTGDVKKEKSPPMFVGSMWSAEVSTVGGRELSER